MAAVLVLVAACCALVGVVVSVLRFDAAHKRRREVALREMGLYEVGAGMVARTPRRSLAELHAAYARGELSLAKVEELAGPIIAAEEAPPSARLAPVGRLCECRGVAGDCGRCDGSCEEMRRDALAGGADWADSRAVFSAGGTETVEC